MTGAAAVGGSRTTKAGLLGSAASGIDGNEDLLASCRTSFLTSGLDSGICARGGLIRLVSAASGLATGLRGTAAGGGLFRTALTAGWVGTAASNLNLLGFDLACPPVAPGLRLSISSICSLVKSKGVWKAENASIKSCFSGLLGTAATGTWALTSGLCCLGTFTGNALGLGSGLASVGG